MACSVDPYNYTATGILGEKRPTMLENELLLRGELGRPMPRGYTNYPGDELRYGRRNVSNDGGAPEALRGWSSGIHFPKVGGADKNTRADRDFMALNRSAVQAGLTTAHENYQFRAHNDIRKKVATNESKNMVRRLPPSLVFGVATRPSTPIHDLLEHKYQDQWLNERRSEDRSRQCAEKAKKGQGVYLTRTSLLRTFNVPVDPAPLWQMPRFAGTARPHLETFRTVRERDGAFKNHQSDCISRRGVIGQGIYEKAKC